MEAALRSAQEHFRDHCLVRPRGIGHKSVQVNGIAYAELSVV